MKKVVKAWLRKVKGETEKPSRVDTYVISYPKSGRTWLRALIGKYLSLEHGIPEDAILSTGFVTSESGLPKVSFSHDESAMQDGLRYQDLSRDRSKYAGRKVILLARDIKDTLVSAFFQATKRRNLFEGSISEFIRTDEYGVRKILAYYEVWLGNRDVPGALLFIRYEEMHKDAGAVLKAVLEFIGVEAIDDDRVASSVDYCAFENLRRLEEKNEFKTSILKPMGDGDPDGFKVRKGQVGGYTEYLSQEDVAYIDGVIAESGFDFASFVNG
jgi:sulfotransferase family protein